MVPLHHPWMRPDRSITHRHTQKHIPTLIDNIAVPPSVCLVGLSHHLREATPSPIHNFDGSIHQSRTHPLDPLFDSIDSYDPSLSSRGLPDPLCMIWIGLHFTHIACKILFEMSSTHIPTNNSRNQPPPHPHPKTKNTHECGLYLSHTPT